MKCRILGLARGMVLGCRPELTGQVVSGWVTGPVGDHQAPGPLSSPPPGPRTSCPTNRKNPIQYITSVNNTTLFILRYDCYALYKSYIVERFRWKNRLKISQIQKLWHKVKTV